MKNTSACQAIIGDQDNPFDYYDQETEYYNYEAQKSKHPESAKILVQKMSEYSESAMLAGWIMGTEYVLWQVVTGRITDWGNHTFTPEEIKELILLSEQCDGWWIWWDEDMGEGETGERFVTKSQWEQIVKAEWE